MAAISEGTLASPERIKILLEEAEEELVKIQPRIDELEQMAQELRELKQVKQHLITLKISLSTLIDTITQPNVEVDLVGAGLEDFAGLNFNNTSFKELSALKTFRPDEAFHQADKILKQKQSLNYEMFKAVVFKGGKASTEEIKAYLVECDAKQPQTGEGFENVSLSEISSRANYLVRKGILHPSGRGSFYSTLGWVDPEN